MLITIESVYIIKGGKNMAATRKGKGFILLLILSIAIIGVTACSIETTDAADENSNIETITIDHPLGKAEVKKNPERIIVFDYATLDSLDLMGIDIIGLPKSTIPEYLSKYRDERYEDVGTLFEPDFEKIYELNPDVIFISDRQVEVYEELNEIAPTVYFQVDGGKYMESITNNLIILGNIFDKEEFVEEELSKINSAMAAIRDRVTEMGANALIVMANDGSISAFGKGSRFGIIHEEFGFTPVDPDIKVEKHGNSISFEYILEKNPDYVFVIDRAATTGGSTTAEQIFDNDIIKNTEAYKNGRIVYLTPQVWYVASGGLRGTYIMIEDIESSLK